MTAPASESFYKTMARQLVYMSQEMVREAGLNLSDTEEVACICESIIRYLSALDDKVRATPGIDAEVIGLLNDNLRYVSGLIPDHLMALYPKQAVLEAYFDGAAGKIPAKYDTMLDVLTQREKDGTFSMSKLADKYPFISEQERAELLARVGPIAKTFLVN